MSKHTIRDAIHVTYRDFITKGRNNVPISHSGRSVYSVNGSEPQLIRTNDIHRSLLPGLQYTVDIEYMRTSHRASIAEQIDMAETAGAKVVKRTVTEKTTNHEGYRKHI